MNTRVEFIGPFEHHEVVVNGWSVPLLHARPHEDGSVDLVLDRRISLSVREKDVIQVTAFLADAIAVAQGLACHPAMTETGPSTMSPRYRSPLEPRRVVMIGDVPADGEHRPILGLVPKED